MDSRFPKSLSEILAKPHVMLLCAMLLTDLLFIFLHILQLATDYPNDDHFRLNWARGYPENFQYIKFLWTGMILFAMAIRDRQLPYLLFSGVYGYMLMDDANEIHEIFGDYFGRMYPDIKVRDVDVLGELVAMGLCGGCVLLAMLIAIYLAKSHVRSLLKTLFWLTMCIGLFAVIVDAMHSAVTHIRYLDDIFRIAEEGGEMIALSCAAAYVIGMPGRKPIDDDDRL
jgi:hypothetical protein